MIAPFVGSPAPSPTSDAGYDLKPSVDVVFELQAWSVAAKVSEDA